MPDDAAFLPETLTDVSSIFRPYAEGPVMIALPTRALEMHVLAEAEQLRATFAAFAAVAAGQRPCGSAVQQFALVGARGGLEAIGAAQIFPDVRRIVIVDRSACERDRARLNLTSNIDPAVQIELTGGPLQAAAEFPAGRLDFLYQNFVDAAFTPPLLSPWRVHPIGAAMPGGNRLEPRDRCQLGDAYQVIEIAKRVMRPDGALVIALGSGIEFAAVDRLAQATGTVIEEVANGLKRQTDPVMALMAYGHAVTGDAAFALYDFERARQSLRGLPPCSGTELQGLLGAFKLSARDAVDACRDGVTIGHTYHILHIRPRAWCWGGAAPLNRPNRSAT